MNKKVAAVVTTFNRRDLLKENINALLCQTNKCDIIIVNNASTDGTEELIQSIKSDKIIYHNTGANLGGAGGFAYGILIGEKLGYEYLWIMDDDSIPKANALESLMRKAEQLSGSFSFLSSLVYWVDGKLFPMNVPRIQFNNYLEELDLIKSSMLAPIKSTSFVGCFINTSVSKKIGLPISEFFIYGDDLEYTKRLAKERPCYLDLESMIVHKAPSNIGADVATASEDRIDRFFFQTRNGMYIAKQEGMIAVLKYITRVVGRGKRVIQGSGEKKMKRLFVLAKGLVWGIGFNPKIKFSERIVKNED